MQPLRHSCGLGGRKAAQAGAVPIPCPEARRAAGISDGLVRVSVGVEDADDLIEYFRSALDRT